MLLAQHRVFIHKYIVSHMATVLNKFTEILFYLECLLSGVLLCHTCVINRQYVPKHHSHKCLKWVIFQLQLLENRRQGFGWLQTIEEALLEIGVTLCQGSDVLDTFAGLDLCFIFITHRGSHEANTVNPDSGHSSHVQLDFSRNDKVVFFFLFFFFSEEPTH